MLLKSVFTVFQRAVNSAESTLAPYLSLNQPKFDPESIPARKRYLVRCSKLVNNIVRWRKYAGERFGIGVLLTRLLENCMLPVAESGWDVGGEEVMRKVWLKLHFVSFFIYTNHLPDCAYGTKGGSSSCFTDTSAIILSLVCS
jgi:hypothetical protein